MGAWCASDTTRPRRVGTSWRQRLRACNLWALSWVPCTFATRRACAHALLPLLPVAPNIVILRLADAADIPALAAARWEFRTEDPVELALVDETTFRSRYESFVGDAMTAGRLVYWIAEAPDSSLAAHMAVVIVESIPRPSRARDRWGYLTDCYVRPAFRNQGVGTELLQRVREWAITHDLELLLTWPSERARSFYQRAGFTVTTDTLVQQLRDYDAPPASDA